MVMKNGKLSETSAVGIATRSLKSWMLRASLGLALLGGPGCFPGTAEDITSSVANCDESVLNNFDLSDDEREIILSRCRDEMAQSQVNPDGSWDKDDYSDDDYNPDGPSRDYPEGDYDPDETNPDHPENDYECRSFLGDLQEFDGDWNWEGDDAVRNVNSDSGSVLISSNRNFRDFYLSTDILLENEDTEMGLVFRARETHSEEGEGYFALVTAVNRELIVGYAHAGGDYDILASRHVEVTLGSSSKLSVSAFGDSILVEYESVMLEVVDNRSMNGALGLLVTQGQGLFTNFIAEGLCNDEYQPDYNDYNDYNDHNRTFAGMGSLQNHEGEWFNDGYLSGNINPDESSFQITSRSFDDLYLHTRALARTANTKMGLLFRGNLDDAGNSQGYFAGLSTEDNELVLGYHIGNGEDIILARAYMNVNIGEFYSIEVEAQGPRIRVYCNEVTLETEADFSFSGVAGLIAMDGLALFTEFSANEIH